MQANKPISHLAVVSGRSGSGKSTALQVLEDCGFYCVDNLPASLLNDLVARIRDDIDSGIGKIAVGVDARNVLRDLRDVPAILEGLRAEVAELDVIYLDAEDSILLNRFSATRRKHPLSSENRSLTDAIAMEKSLLSPIADEANLHINTSEMTVHELREHIKQHVRRAEENSPMTVIIQSFGFKHGLPPDADFVFDVRCLPNPFWIPTLRPHTGLDEPIQAFLQATPQVQTMCDDILAYIHKWLPAFEHNDRSYLTIGIGCTGGQHRSVYVAHWLQKQLARDDRPVHIKHRELPENSGHG